MYQRDQQKRSESDADETLVGTVERITHYKEDSGWGIVALAPETEIPPHVGKAGGTVSAVGVFPVLNLGERLHLTGSWERHPHFGWQFKARVALNQDPVTVDGIEAYLGSGMIKGIGPSLAAQIVARFGAKTLEIIDQNPLRLAEVPGIGQSRVESIVSAWAEQRNIRKIMIFLMGHGISTTMATKIFKQYDNEAIHVVTRAPYRLAEDIRGIGFLTADKIAQAMGIRRDAPERIDCGLIYTLQETTNQGHVYLDLSDLLDRAARMLGVAHTMVEDGIKRLAGGGRVVVESVPGKSGLISTQAVYLPYMHRHEVSVSEKLRRLMSASSLEIDIPAEIVSPDGMALAEEQLQGIRTALTSPVSVLTGGPGTGKTQTIKTLITLVEQAGIPYALAAPTGRAAKRMTEATSFPASTIHRMLRYKPDEGFLFNEENPLPVSLLVLDEVSMMDIALADAVLKALEEGTHLILVGDVDQLPSVGPGNFLRDVIESEVVPVTRLTHIFRQAAESRIISNAHRVRQGMMPELHQDRDFFVFGADGDKAAADWVVDLVTNRIPAKFGLRPDQIQVISPMYRGEAGVDALNTRLQEALNPPSPFKPERQYGSQIFRVGDRVMQIQNNYDKGLGGVFNGDMGVVAAVNPKEGFLTVNFDGMMVEYDKAEAADQLVLSYSISVHKSQGGEYPAIVLVLISQHYPMLQRNLFYTGLTRAKSLCVLVADQKAVGMAVRNHQVSKRNTALLYRLQNGR